MATTLVIASGYFLAELSPSALITAMSSDWYRRMVDLFLGQAVALGIAGFICGVGYLVILRREVSNKADAVSEAIELSMHDPLTGLPNRRKFHQDFGPFTQKTNGDQFRAVMMLDVDGFKPINDVYGHAFGDALLREFALRVTDVVGQAGFVARLGGDEFAIVTPTLDEKIDAANLARRLLARISETFTIDGRQVQVGTGIGIAIFPDNGYSASELLRRSDIALYRAKSSGRSVFRFFEKEMDAAILHRTLLEQRLRAAMTADDIHVHFQPILNLANQEIMGFEALARWTDRDYGSILPTQFIMIAEDCGIITDLSEQLLTKACKVAATWPTHMFLSFNVSQIQLHDHSFPLKVIAILAETGLPAERLILEITETALLKNPHIARAILEQLDDARVRIALDDFGTGHSTFSYLRDYPISKVKIDRSFTMKMTEDPECAAIINSILVLAKGLGIETVAEGIEQADISARLHENGCEFGQGYLFGAAKNAATISELIERSKPGLKAQQTAHKKIT